MAVINRVGETQMMNCGMEATIIRYGRNNDIDVRFEDETVAEHRQYGQFKKGGIANSNIKAFAENHLGETRMMNCGMEATIFRYGTCADIDVRFEDGTVAEHKRYDIFRKAKSLMSHSVKNAVPKISTVLSVNRDLKMKIELFTNASVNIAGWRMF